MGHIYHPVKNLYPKMFHWWYVIIVISRFCLASDYNSYNQGFMLKFLASKLSLLLSLFLLSHINIINDLVFLRKKLINMAMGCHRIPFWPEQDLSQLTNALFISFFFPQHIITASPALYHSFWSCFFGMFVPYDTNITPPLGSSEA